MTMNDTINLTGTDAAIKKMPQQNQVFCKVTLIKLYYFKTLQDLKIVCKSTFKLIKIYQWQNGRAGFVA